MKLVNTLAVAFLGALMVTGCTVTDDTGTDGGTDGGTDTLTPPSDTLKSDTPASDTATGETAGDTGTDCPTCVTANCKTEITACSAEPSCQSGLDCFNAAGCDTTCKNSCLSNSKNPDGTAGNNKLADIVSCAASKCKTPCGL